MISFREIDRQLEGTFWRSVKAGAAAHAELLEIHRIGMCIAECPPIKDTDTITVRMVKEMAIRLNNSGRCVC